MRTAGGSWNTCGIEKMYVANNTSTPSRTDSTYVAKIEMSQPVEIEITTDFDIDSFQIRPLSKKIVAQNDKRHITFTLPKPMYLSVEINGQLFQNLNILADAHVKCDYDIYFGPGEHRLKGDTLAVKSNQTVYLDKDAIVRGWLAIDDAHDVKIIGHGTILPVKHEGIMIRRSKNIVIDGPLTTQIPVGESDSVIIRNAKTISHFSWGDGLNVFASNNVTYQNVFCRTSDDCSTIYCTRKGYHGSCRNILIDGAVYWADVAHPIMIGLHGDVEKNETIENVIYRNIDILYQSEKQIDYQGCIAINNGDNILVKNLLFENVNIERIDNGMLFNVRVCYNKKYCNAPGRGIEDVTFRNISYKGQEPNVSLFVGYNEERKIKGIHFENLEINGRIISDDMPGKPRWYKTADMAHCFIGEHVEQVSFSNTLSASQEIENKDVGLNDKTHSMYNNSKF